MKKVLFAINTEARLLKYDFQKFIEKSVHLLWDVFQKPIVKKVLIVSVLVYIEILLIRALFIVGDGFPLPNIILGVAMSIILPIIAFSILDTTTK